MGRCSGESELAGAHRSVLGHLNTSLAGLRSQPKDKEVEVKTALHMLDILLVLAPYLPVVRKAEVVDVVVRGGVLDVSDGVVGMRLVPLSPRRRVIRSVRGVMALSRVLFESALCHVRSMNVESNYCLVQMSSRQSTSLRFSMPSIAFSLQEIVKLSRVSSVSAGFLDLGQDPTYS